MRKNFIFKLHTYPFKVMVSLGEKEKDLSKTLKKLNVDCNKECVSVKGCAGYFIPFSNYLLLIRSKKYPKTSQDFAILQHEILHCCFFILKEVGIRLSPKSEEAYTYLLETITYKILKQIKKNGN